MIFTSQAGKNTINVKIEDETVWLTQKLIGVLFDKGRSTIAEHLINIFQKNELDKNAVCRKFRHTGNDGKIYNTKFYNLVPQITNKAPIPERIFDGHVCFKSQGEPRFIVDLKCA